MYDKAFTEVNEIFNYLPEEQVKMIPSSFIKMILEHMDYSYDFKYNPDIPFEEQNLLDETKAILEILYIQFWQNKDKEVKPA